MSVALNDRINEQIRSLIEDHKNIDIEREPLHLALLYEPTRDRGDIFVFEVIGGFGGGVVDPERELMEVSFGSSATFPLEEGREVHLVLTSPEEFEKAVEEEWPMIQEVRESIKNENYSVLSSDKKGEDFLERLKP